MIIFPSSCKKLHLKIYKSRGQGIVCHYHVNAFDCLQTKLKHEPKEFKLEKHVAI